jgi:hypothetical protein
MTDYRQNATNEEKLRTLFNDRNVLRQKDTFASRANAELDLENTGRHSKPQQIVGTTPAPEYPAGPNWSPDPTGIEPPLGYDINEPVVVGEPHEINASLSEATAPAASIINAAVEQQTSRGDTTKPGPEGASIPSSSLSERVVSPNQSPKTEPETDPVVSPVAPWDAQRRKPR